MFDVLRLLNMPEWLNRCASGDVIPPEFTYDVPCDLGYGFPPAIIPIWSSQDGPDYLGVLKHWFSNRQTTFVRYNKECESFIEIARTPDQLRIWLAFRFFCNVPDEDEVAAFMKAVYLCDDETFADYFRGYEDASDLMRNPTFVDRLPLDLVQDRKNYNGDFPHGEIDFRRYCGFEVPTDMIPTETTVAPWFRAENKPNLFNELLSINDLQGAWFTLNSSGWQGNEMKIAIQQLAAKTDIPGLKMVSDWLSQVVSNNSQY